MASTVISSLPGEDKENLDLRSRRENLNLKSKSSPNKKISSTKDDESEITSSKDDHASALSPYERKFETVMKAADEEARLLWVSNVGSHLHRAGLVPDGKDSDDMEEEERKKALQQLSQPQVDDIHAIIVSRVTISLKEAYRQDILHADDPDSRKDGSRFVMLRAGSCYAMYPVISKQFTAATREINKAERLVKVANREIPGVAKTALEITLAVVLAAHNEPYWRSTSGVPEEVEKLKKRLVRMMRSLLWFTNAELGWTDSDNISRQGLLEFLGELTERWSCGAVEYLEKNLTMNFRVPRNGYGLGRPLRTDDDNNNKSDSNPKPKKKQKMATNDPTALAAASNNNSAPSMTSFFLDINSKLDKRIKTLVQLQITDLDFPDLVEHVVVSGNTDMKKMQQLLAFLTGCTDVFDYRLQRGAPVKDCRFELSLPGYRTCWISPAADKKQATKADVDFVVDKCIKIVQIFQGLNCSPNGGLRYDSDMAKTIATTPQALVFSCPSARIGWVRRYAMQVKAIAPNKAGRYHVKPLPRVVTYRKSQKRSGLGLLSLWSEAKAVLQGDRNEELTLFSAKTTAAQMRKHFLDQWTRPICDLKGTNVCSGERDKGYTNVWAPDHVLEAGFPAGVNQWAL